MIGVQVTITRFVDEAQPGWVECKLTDIHEQTWMFVEKAPVVSKAILDTRSAYPQQGVIACEIFLTWLDITGREVVTIDTSTPWGVKSTSGKTQFDVFSAQLTQIEAK
jgi:hypothetical protein